jgi:hypothetical protein
MLQYNKYPGKLCFCVNTLGSVVIVNAAVVGSAPDTWRLLRADFRVARVFGQNMPNYHKTYQMGIGFENIPSGNPGGFLLSAPSSVSEYTT